MTPPPALALQRTSTTGAPSSPDGALPFVVSIDTEEDNWTPTRDRITVENIRELPKLQAMLDRLGARATYFTTHQVAVDQTASAIMREIAASGRAEIGGHLHPWNTPPLDEPLGGRMTMLKNLPSSLQAAKLRTLTDTLAQQIGVRPVAFRAGRWGVGADTIDALLSNGYRVDSSVTPFVNWQSYDDGPDHDGAPVGWYRLARGGDVRVPVSGGPLLELPASFGYTRAPFGFWHQVHRTLAAPAYRWTRLGGLVDRTGVVRKVALSPETDTANDMLRLAFRLRESGVPYLHMFWHSPSLRPGLSPFVHTWRDVDRFYRAIETFIERLGGRMPLRFMTVSEAATLLARDGGSAAIAPRRELAALETAV